MDGYEIRGKLTAPHTCYENVLLLQILRILSLILYLTAIDMDQVQNTYSQMVRAVMLVCI